MSSSFIATAVRMNAPVLCLDTCTVLDSMRDPTREGIRPHERQAGLELLRAAETGTDLIALVAEQVQIEFNEHAQAVEEEAARALRQLRERIERTEAIAAVYGPGGKANLSHLDNHIIRSRKVVDRWIAAAEVVVPSADVPSRAFLRLNQARAPARKGKDSAKDCIVIETYLEVAAQLRSAGAPCRIVFASSNTKDYTGEPGTTLRPELAAEFATLGIEYAPNMAAAKHALGI